LGVVAKIDTREVRAPFVKAGIVTGTIAVLMIAVGSLCFFQIADPMVRRIEASEAKQRAVRKRAEKALKRAHHELQLIFDAADPLCVIDTDNRISRVNGPFCELFDVSREEVLGKRCCDIWRSTKCHTKRCALKRIIAGVQRVDYELDQPHDDGSVISCAVTAIPYRDPGGELLGIVKNFVDITERKQAEEELKDKNRDLETLFYVTSHDLREPLRTIHNFAELIDSRYAERLDRKGRDFLGRIIRGANRLDRLVADILTLSRAQRMVTPSDWVDAADMVDDVLQRLETKILESRAMVFVAAELPQLFVDRIWATQAIYNLVANALKFTRDGESPIVEIDAYCPTHAAPVAGIVVRDCGPGILPEYRERVFGLFQRVVGRDVEGTGAGLAIVQQIARRHGGDVRVESAPTGGSEFILTFAIPPQPSAINPQLIDSQSSAIDKEPEDGHDYTSPDEYDAQCDRDLVGGRQ
ncbi:MAG TPA: ATP-binding protein, partial [Thermoguttaceae bacterium]|nr:ATP-binding protein [Thermoguttaceae bacterium]